MTREEFLKAITEYNIKVSALHNLYYKYIDSPIGFMTVNVIVIKYYIMLYNQIKHI